MITFTILLNCILNGIATCNFCFSVSDYICTLLLQTITCQVWLCTTTVANNLIAVGHLTINIFSPISSIYLLFSLQHYLLPFHPLTTNDTLHKLLLLLLHLLLKMARVDCTFTCSYSLLHPFPCDYNYICRRVTWGEHGTTLPSPTPENPF